MPPIAESAMHVAQHVVEEPDVSVVVARTLAPAVRRSNSPSRLGQTAEWQTTLDPTQALEAAYTQVTRNNVASLAPGHAVARAVAPGGSAPPSGIPMLPLNGTQVDEDDEDEENVDPSVARIVWPARRMSRASGTASGAQSASTTTTTIPGQTAVVGDQSGGSMDGLDDIIVPHEFTTARP